MNQELIIMPLYAEDSSVISLVLSTNDGSMLKTIDIIDALRTYADILETKDEIPN